MRLQIFFLAVLLFGARFFFDEFPVLFFDSSLCSACGFDRRVPFDGRQRFLAGQAREYFSVLCWILRNLHSVHNSVRRRAVSVFRTFRKAFDLFFYAGISAENMWRAFGKAKDEHKVFKKNIFDFRSCSRNFASGRNRVTLDSRRSLAFYRVFDARVFGFRGVDFLDRQMNFCNGLRLNFFFILPKIIV